ncbi:hypothetical protein ACS0TY_033568 [Phlomoides rotata]
MGLSGKLVSEIKIKSDGDVFHQLFKERPHHIAGMTDTIQNCELHQGQWGAAGFVTLWNYTHDGKEYVSKVITHVDEEKKWVAMEVIEGDVMEFYKEFKATVQVETKDDDNLVSWTIEYEKLEEEVPEPHGPHSIMDLYLRLTKDIETHHLNN